MQTGVGLAYSTWVIGTAVRWPEKSRAMLENLVTAKAQQDTEQSMREQLNCISPYGTGRLSVGLLIAPARICLCPTSSCRSCL